MRTDIAPTPVRLVDYRPTDYLIDTVDLDVRLQRNACRVVARLALRPNPKGRLGAPLILDGDGLNVKRVALDGVERDLAGGFALPDSLTISSPPSGAFNLVIETLVDAEANTQLSGLYRSGAAWCTQCEAEGFRRITYFLDRPDVLSVYTTRIEADKSEAPILLSNGNPVISGDITGTTRHFAVWHDPHPKPCYLFALVGGSLSALHDKFTTMSGRNVALSIYVEPGKQDRAAYAMDSLKRSMKWDEEKFGREYDLDVFNIVAVSDFNMGAMENKGLNVFNDKYVLASPRTATDVDYAGIEAVIAHEYFHNWTGNRITCRDWFQLCLKEGLTVFRDHEFSSDQRSRPVRRIANVRNLRAAQFVEDAGPLAHNVRPESYMEINNFYTATVYEKGAEVIRALKTLIGDTAFRAGMDLYFARYDGTAATVEDFIGCFDETSGRDLTQFMRWYSQSGTPVITARGEYDEATRTFSLDLAQSAPPTPGQPTKQPFVLPVSLGLVSGNGGDMELKSPDASAGECAHGVFELSGPGRRIVFHDVATRPIPSLLRNFSAPVRLDYDYSNDDLLTLARRDSDPFNRWQALQTYSTRLLVKSTAAVRAGEKPLDDERLADAFGALIDERERDNAFTALALALPSEGDLAREIASDVDPDAIRVARQHLRKSIAARVLGKARDAYEAIASETKAFSPDAASAGRRSLRAALLALVAAGDASMGDDLAQRLFDSANNMTDKSAALAQICETPGARREATLGAFYSDHVDDALVIDKWFTLQAMIPEPETLSRVRDLMSHPAFSMGNPNRLRALVGAFTSANPTQFHAPDGAGYKLLSETVTEVDPKNPQVAARLLGALRTWRTMEPKRRAQAEQTLRKISAHNSLSRDTRDIVDRTLA